MQGGIIPAKDIFPITPNDSSGLSQMAYGLLVGTAGNLKVTTAAGNDRVFWAPVGYIGIQVSKVFDTGTDADNISGFTAK